MCMNGMKDRTAHGIITAAQPIPDWETMWRSIGGGEAGRQSWTQTTWSTEFPEYASERGQRYQNETVLLRGNPLDGGDKVYEALLREPHVNALAEAASAAAKMLGGFFHSQPPKCYAFPLFAYLNTDMILDCQGL